MNKLEALKTHFLNLLRIKRNEQVKTNWLFHIGFYFWGAIIIGAITAAGLEKGDVRYFTKPIVQADSIRLRI